MTILSNEEIVDQYQRAAEPEKMNHLLILYEQNRDLIAYVAKRYQAFADFEDLLQEGFFGLLAAADNYDPEQGSFSAYAVMWLRQAMRRYIDNNQTVVRFPVHIRDHVFKYRQILQKYIEKYGKSPTDREMMRLLKVSSEQYRKIAKNDELLRIRSIDEIMSTEDDTYTLADTLPDPEAEKDFEKVIEIADNERLHDLLWDADYLTEQEKIVIKERYQGEKILDEIGSQIKVSKERVRKIEMAALKKYRRDKQLQQYRDDYISGKAYKGTGLSAFQYSGTSATEKVAIDLYERKMQVYEEWIERKMKEYEKQLEREVQELSQQSGIDLTEYKKLKLALFKDDLYKRSETMFL